MLEAMRHVQQGRLCERLRPTGNDELDILARQFNVMVEQLDQNDQTIRDLNTGLEKKVRRRTRQLSRSRRTLKQSLDKLTESRSAEDRVLLQRQPRIAHAADDDPGAGRSAAAAQGRRPARRRRPTCSKWSASTATGCST